MTHTDPTAWQEIIRLSQRLAATPTIAGQRDIVVETAGRLLGGQATLWLTKPVYRLVDPQDPTAIPAEPATGLMRRAFESGKAEAGPGPAIAVPLLATDATVGVLHVERAAEQPFDKAEVELLQGLTIQAALAVENSRRYELSQAQAWISTVLLQVAEAIQSLTTLDQVLETVVRLTPMLAGVDRCAVFLWDNPAEAFMPGAAYGLDPGQQAAFEQLRIKPRSEPAFDDLRLFKEPVAIPDATADSSLSAVSPAPLLLLPLIAHDETVGAMLVDNRSRESEFEDEWRTMVQGIAQQAAAGLESTRLLEAQQEEAYVLASLLQVAETVAGLNDLSDTLSAILRTTAIMIGVQRAIIFLWDTEQARFRAAEGYGIPQAEALLLWARQYPPGGFPLLDMIRTTDRVTLVDTPERWEALVPRDFTASFAGFPESPTRSLLAVPVSLQGNVLGVIVIEEDDEASRHFRQKRMEIITGVAQQAALAVHNDRYRRDMATRERLERELQLAREIQQTLMPTELPDLAGWELAVACRPALQVSGDFYDFFELPGGRLGLVIADVADKGMPAALFMALTRALIRAAALQETSPAAALARVNDLLVPDAHQGMFVTAVYATLALETGHVIYANAGHNLPLLYRSASHEVERLVRCGMALGAVEGSRLDEHILRLNPGDHLVLFTDGITEAFSPTADAYGETRLREAIRAAADGPARNLLSAIDRSVATFVGDTPPSDDVTLMVLRRLAS